MYFRIKIGIEYDEASNDAGLSKQEIAKRLKRFFDDRIELGGELFEDEPETDYCEITVDH